MADEPRTISRRERREMEERAAAPSTPAPGMSIPEYPSSGSLPTLEASSDTAAQALVSRRDRRRIERLENPVETWSAEEEIRHTGSIPTVTPEVIAQQERLAREKAAAIQEDAIRSTGSIPIVRAQTVVPPAAAAPADGIPEAYRHMFPPGSLQAQAMEAEQARAGQAALTGGGSRYEAESAYLDAQAQAQAPAQSFEVPGFAVAGYTGETPVQQFAVDPSRPPVPQVEIMPPQSVPGFAEFVAPGAPSPQGAPYTPPPQASQQQPGPPGTHGMPLAPPPHAPYPASGQFATPPPPGAILVQQGVRPPAGMVAMQPGQPGMAIAMRQGGMDPTATGTFRAIPSLGTGAIPRPMIDVQPAGGMHHFGWPQIGLLAAVAFVLGIVAWNVAGPGG